MPDFYASPPGWHMQVNFLQVPYLYKSCLPDNSFAPLTHSGILKLQIFFKTFCNRRQEGGVKGGK
jgi:hypothetical protein